MRALQDVDEFLNWVHPGRELKMLRAEARHDKVLLSDQLWRCLCLKPLHGMALSRPEGITEKVATNMVAVDEALPKSFASYDYLIHHA